MPPRTKLTKHSSPMATEGLQSSEWERSRISNQDVNLLKKLGFMKKENTLIFPGDESYPTPRIGYRNTHVKELSGIQITAYFLRIRVQPLQARKNPLWMYAGAKYVDRFSKDLSTKDLERLIRKMSSLSKKDTIPSSCRVEPFSSTNALHQPLMQQFIRLGTQFIGYRDHANSLKEALAKANKRADDLALELAKSEKAREKAELESASVESLRKRLHDAENSLSERISQQIACEAGKMSQEYQLEKPEDDRLLDALSLLEIYGDEARQSISDAKAGFSRLFPYFFPKTEEPNTFAALAKRFIPKEDLGLALRQENLKIGIEGTIALVAESQQNVNWPKVGDVKNIETKRWKSMIKAAKPHSKKILVFLGYRPTPSSSSADTSPTYL
ncbi:hypothetical protein QYE76_052186 [Lolium multiflorum]|uniref:Uncharacterized protein n=1 Tax=Lolium multiflorum TaxID=4521 RepID=A0AAD8WIP7_LOLMU|nr:hypothetical protein QYE76_052186 [Lolium multiflorum]